MKKLISFLLFSVLTNDFLGQDTIQIVLKNKNINTFDVDEFANVYLGTEDGLIFKYNSKGEFLVSYSPSLPKKMEYIQAINPIRIFCFYRDLQEFNYFDRFLTFDRSVQFDSNIFGFVKLACLSSDNSIWVLDDVDFSIKKFDPIQSKVTQKIYIGPFLGEGKFDFGRMVEFQNRLYLLDRQFGIYVFDNFGNFLKNYSIPGCLDIKFEKKHMDLILKESVLRLDVNSYERLVEINIGEGVYDFLQKGTFRYFLKDGLLLISAIAEGK